jgi:ATP-dependent Lon protease
VLPIGGLKEKILAAKRAKLSMVILPKRNKEDLEDIPKHLLKGIQLTFADTMDDVLKAGLRRAGARAATPKPARQKRPRRQRPAPAPAAKPSRPLRHRPIAPTVSVSPSSRP